MKSGMKVELAGLGETQVIGEIVDGKFSEVWGIGYQGGHEMKPTGKLLKDIMKACKKHDNEDIITRAKLIQSELEDRLDCIREVAEKINKEVVC